MGQTPCGRKTRSFAPGHGAVLDVGYSCGNAAHLHEKVLPEVVFGEFHPTIRALEVIDLVEELYVSASSLLSFPVTQRSLAEIHAPYLSRACRIPFRGGDMFGDDIY